MIKCCETFGDSDMDCQLMHLMGGDMGLLYPNITKNISLLYPNMVKKVNARFPFFID